MTLLLAPFQYLFMIEAMVVAALIGGVCAAFHHPQKALSTQHQQFLVLLIQKKETAVGHKLFYNGSL